MDIPHLGYCLGTFLRVVQSWPHPSPEHCGRSGPGGMTAGELSLPLARCFGKVGHHTVKELQVSRTEVVRRAGPTTHLRRDALLLPHPSPPATGGRHGLGVMETGKLFLPLTSSSTQESRYCTSSGQQGRVDPGGRGVGEPALKVSSWESWPHHLSAMWWHGEGEKPPSPLATYSRQGSWPLTCCST